MQALRTRPGLHRGGILSLRLEDIAPNPVQPRKHFDEQELQELSESIRTYGILNPLTVRLRCGKYELVAGERRLRAARLAGLQEVPCILVDVNLEEAGLLALVENLQRKDLDFLEEAEGLRKLIRMFALSQEEADVLDSLRQNGLSERHGRALLRLPDGESQRSALAVMLEKGMNVSAAERYVDELLAERPAPPAEKPRPKKTFVMKDLRVFLNTLSHSVELMKQGGIGADLRREEREDATVITISIPRQAEKT